MKNKQGRDYWKGKTFSKLHKKRISESNKGKRLPKKVREKISATMKEINYHKKTDTARNNMREAHLGKKHSEKTKRKISKAVKMDKY